ncbi:MAG: alcohol dehydrogenase catalytic domain-containing protein [Clostridiales bacterium]|nr:alcohol dehydrogenase catalytic domain-containing protein [Clostridiales bacterium]HBM80550.1 hypothetical protein [Clostridiaceae bacterium]
MKAAVWIGKNQVEVKEVEDPKIKSDEVLVKVKSAGICSTDIHVIKGDFYNGNPPHILGHEIAGDIIEIGEKVDRWKNGDRVVVETMVNCGDCYYCRRGMKNLCDHGGDIGFPPYQGGYAEYIAVPARCLYRIPDNVTYDEAGILESFICPAGSIFRLGMHFGDTILIQGAGPAGLAYVQSVRACGAGKIIVAARNEKRLRLAKKFGAHVVIDIQKENMESRIMEETDGHGVDISIDAAGFPSTVENSIKYVRKGGNVILYGIPDDRDYINFPVTQIILKQLSVHGASGNPHVWQPVLDLLSQGIFNLKDMVTHTFTLDQFNEAVDFVSKRKDGVIKAVVHP